jgi:hypothetical protein
MLNGWRIKHAGPGDRGRSVTGTTIALAWIPPTGTVAIMDRTIAGAGDYRSQRDEGYSGDSGYRRAYPIKEISVRSALRSALRTQPAVTLVRLVSSRQKH